MAATQIKEMRPTHEGVLDLVLANPHQTLENLGLATGYSPAWLSQMMRSDCFRAAYDARRGDIEAQVMMPLQAKLAAVAELAIDKVSADLLASKDKEHNLDAFDKIMHAAGYAPNSKSAGAAPAIGVQNNTFIVNKDDLREAREVIINPPQPAQIAHDAT